jgi:thiosulfate reductase cytochrome b subunit
VSECYERAVAQARFYTVGIFRGEPHPHEKRPDDKFSPLQRLTYLALLNILLPLQVVSGLALWGAQHWPGPVDAVGGLAMLAKIHTAVAWIFAAFLIGHLYMITTGPKPTTYLKGMISGWETVEGEPEESRG